MSSPPPTYRDDSGRALTDYPQPSVAVDTAVLTVTGDELGVVLVSGGAGPALPGTFLHASETLADAVLRSLRDKAGLEGLAPRQLHVFDRPDRDSRGWVLSVAHRVVVPDRMLTLRNPAASVVPLERALAQPLAYDHAEIIRLAVRSLRDDYADSPDPEHLLAEPFTLRELQRVHEAVAGAPVPRDAFRRAMEPRLRETGELARGGRGKPARLFRHLEQHRR